MPDLGELHLVSTPERIGGTILNEIVFSKAAVPFPLFGYMDTSLSIVIRFNLPLTSESDLIAEDPLNPESYTIPGVRVMSVEFADSGHTKVRLYLNKAPAYYPASFVVTVVTFGLSEVVSVASIVERPLNIADQETQDQFVDVKVFQSGSKAGAIALKAGDYSLSGTNETIRKLVNEMFAVKRGEMLHDPEFGNRIRLKGLRSSADLLQQQADMRSRIITIPQVAAASISVSFDDNLPEVVRFRVKIRTVTGSDLDLDSAVTG